MAGLLPDTDEIYLFPIGNNGASVGLQPPQSVPLSDSSQFIFGGFVPTTPLGQFLVFTPGEQTAYSIPLEPNHTYGVVFGTAKPLGLPVRPWSVQPGPGPRQFTLITASGAASVYDFDGTTLTLHSTIALPAGVSGTWIGCGGLVRLWAAVFPIRKTVVPQTEHVPRVPGAPRRVQIGWGFSIGVLARQVMQ